MVMILSVRLYFQRVRLPAHINSGDASRQQVAEERQAGLKRVVVFNVAEGQKAPNGAIQYGTPLTTDSLYATAEAAFVPQVRRHEEGDCPYVFAAETTAETGDDRSRARVANLFPAEERRF